jgi:hypothetical protein
LWWEINDLGISNLAWPSITHKTIEEVLGTFLLYGVASELGARLPYLSVREEFNATILRHDEKCDFYPYFNVIVE